MDIGGIIGGGVNTGSTFGPKPKVQVPVEQALPQAPQQQKVQMPVEIPQVQLAKADMARYEAVKMAAEARRNMFAVGDTTFAIYKDFTGSLVTRFKSLRDGSVTYYPETTMYEMAAALRAKGATIINTEV